MSKEHCPHWQLMYAFAVVCKTLVKINAVRSLAEENIVIVFVCSSVYWHHLLF